MINHHIFFCKVACSTFNFSVTVDSCKSLSIICCSDWAVLTLLISLKIRSSSLPWLLFAVCLHYILMTVGNAPKCFLPPGKCNEQTLWLLRGRLCIPNKFSHTSFKFESTGNLWKDSSGCLMLLPRQSGTQHVVLPCFFPSAPFPFHLTYLPKQTALKLCCS